MSKSDTALASGLIMVTKHHQPVDAQADMIMLIDADLFILGSEPDDYTAYVAAVRAEYSHVSDADWRTGRRAVMTAFLERPQIFLGEWAGRERREEQSRANIRAEINRLDVS